MRNEKKNLIGNVILVDLDKDINQLLRSVSWRLPAHLLNHTFDKVFFISHIIC